MLNLSLLDFGSVYPPGVYAHDVINDLFSEIEFYEELGYKRYWMAEHWVENAAWASPEPLIPLLAGHTRKIKIGLAGVLLKYHSPIRVAQAFTLLSSLFPERIDLGLAKGDIHESYLKLTNIKKYPTEKYFFKQVNALMNLMRPELGKTDVKIQPVGAGKLDFWLLGSSPKIIHNAIKYKTNLCLSLFHSDKNIHELSKVISTFKKKFFEKNHFFPEISIAIQVNCSTSETTIKKFKKESHEKGWKGGIKVISGKPSEVAEKVTEVYQTLKVDEIVILNSYYNLKEKKESVSLIADSLINKAKS